MLRRVRQIFRVCLVLVPLLLTGCLQYDLDIQFDSQTHGQIVQRLQWRHAVSPTPALAQWQMRLSERVEQLGGTLQTPTANALEVTIPFHNGADLERRFNALFADTPDPWRGLPEADPIRAELTLDQQNRFLAIRNHLQLTVDLRSVPDLSDSAIVPLRTATLLDGTVHITAPTTLAPALPALDGQQSDWSLQPGRINHIEAHFWVPSPIGWGAIAIALLVAIGYGLRYGLGIGRRQPR